MSKKPSWLTILPVFFVSAVFATGAHADSLDDMLNKDLFTSQLSTPKDREQADFKKEGVEQAPTPLTAAEEKQLRPMARLLWNRDWYLDHPGQNESQADKDKQRTKRVPEAVAEYNKVIEDIKLARKQLAQNADVEKPAKQPVAQNVPQCQPAANPLVTDNLKNIVVVTNTSAQQVVHAEQTADETQVQADHLDPIPVNLESEPASSPPQKVVIPDGGYLTTMAQDPAHPQTIYALDLLPGVSNVVEGNAVVQKYTYEFVRSGDGGKSWTVVQKFMTAIGESADAHIAISKNAKDIFLTTSDGVMQSGDGGKTFSILQESLGSPVDVKLSSDGTRLAVSYGNGEGVQTFTDQNGNWAKAPDQPSDLIAWVNRQYKTDPRCQKDTFGDCPFDSGANLKVFSVQMDPTQPGVLYAGLGRGEYKYQNGTWSLLQGLDDDSTVTDIEIGSNGKMLVSTCNGIYQGQTSQDQVKKVTSANFINQDTGASSPDYLRSFEVSVNPENANDVVSVSASGVYISKDGGVSWNREDLGAASGKDALNISNEFRSAVWLADGAIEVSSPSGVYRFTP